MGLVLRYIHALYRRPLRPEFVKQFEDEVWYKHQLEVPTPRGVEVEEGYVVRFSTFIMRKRKLIPLDFQRLSALFLLVNVGCRKAEHREM